MVNGLQSSHYIICGPTCQLATFLVTKEVTHGTKREDQHNFCHSDAEEVFMIVVTASTGLIGH